jgi:pimeloyl-ACP methyl ester carboxylesterase
MPEGDSELLVFFGGTQIGREQVRVTRAAGNWIVSSTATFGPPLNMTVHRFETKYTPDWQPIDLLIDATQGTRRLSLATSFSVTSAINEITQNGVTSSKTDQISARTLLLPNNFYAGYTVFAARLAGASAGADFPVYVAPQGEIHVTVTGVTSEQVVTPGGAVATRRYDLSYQNPGGAIGAKVVIDDKARFVRLEIPSASLAVVRSDLATVATRTQTVKNATDADVTIPAAGFVLSGTITTPAVEGKLRHPAIVLAGGATETGRDENIAGVPIFAQLAGALADKGFIVLRYDKRGVGQSGGRIESATLQDYAEDAVAAVKWLARRKDVDPNRVTVLGHREGGWIALLAAAREHKIRSLVLVATPGTTGSELVMEQQRHALDALKTPEADRQAKIDLQTKINNAVINERGWEGVPPAMRRQAETPYFRSLLMFEPAAVMKKVHQPLFILQPDTDTQVPKAHAERLAEIARARKKAPAVDVKHVDALAAPAVTGAAVEWLRKQ